MSERDLLDGLNDSLSIEDLMRVPESQGLAEQDARLARLRGEPGAQERSIRAPDLDGEPRRDGFSGKGSWYSQLPQYGWVDREDRPGSNALGVPDEKQGIALPSRATLGQWFDVTFPDGQTHRLQQTDVGPAKWTGKGIDISAAAAHEAGYSPKNFPTGGNFTWKPAAEGDLSYDTEDRTAVGLGGSRAYAPEITTVPDTGRRKMANGEEPRGIMDFLTGGRPLQQPQGGLLGMLGDPETMSYIAMMLKGASPYSNLDPNAMLSNAHTIAMRKAALEQQRLEHAADNRRADERLGLDRQRFGLTEREYNEKFAEQTAQREADRKARDLLLPGTRAAVPDQTETPSTETAPTETRRQQLETRLENLNKAWQASGSDKQRQQLRMDIERTEKALGMSASEQRTYTEAKEAKSGAEAAKLQVDRAVDLLQNPNLYEGIKSGAAGVVGRVIGESSLPDNARESLELSRIMTTEGLQELAKHLKPLSEKEGRLITELMNAPGMALSEKKRRMEALQAEINKRQQGAKDTISDLEERERAGTAARRRGPPETGNTTRDMLKNKYGLE